MLNRVDIGNQIAKDNGIDAATDEGRLLIARLTLESIGNILLYDDLETITKDDLASFKDEMSAILRFCHEMLVSNIGERLDIQLIIPLVNKANTHLLSASSLYKRLSKAPEYYELYYGHLQNFRDRVFEIREQLEEP